MSVVKQLIANETYKSLAGKYNVLQYILSDPAKADLFEAYQRKLNNISR